MAAYASGEDFLGGEEREPLAEVEAALGAEYALCSDSCAVCLDRTVVDYVPEDIQILFHRIGLFCGE